MNKKAIFDFSKGQKTPVKTAVIGALAAFSALYLINPTAGFFEFIPDNIPFLGNVDEFTAAMLLLNSLKYFGFDLMGMFTGEKDKEDVPSTNVEPRYEPPTK